MKAVWTLVLSFFIAISVWAQPKSVHSLEETFSFIAHLAPQLLLDAGDLLPLVNPEPVDWDQNLPQDSDLEGAVLYSQPDSGGRLESSSFEL